MKTFIIKEEIPATLHIESVIIAETEEEALSKYKINPDEYSYDAEVKYNWDKNKINIIENTPILDNYNYKDIINDIKSKFGKIYYFNDLNKNKSIRRIKIYYSTKGNTHLIENYLKSIYPDLDVYLVNSKSSVFNGVCFKLPNK